MSKKEWKQYAKDLEAYVREKIWPAEEPGTVERVEVKVEKKWMARLILDFRKHYIQDCCRTPTHIFLPPEYLETLLMQLPPGTLSESLDPDMRIFGMRIVTKLSGDELAERPAGLRMRPFAMWEHLRDA